MVEACPEHQIRSYLESVLHTALSHDERVQLRTVLPIDHLLQSVTCQSVEDLLAFSYRDPAVHGRPDLVLYNSSSFIAVLTYRLANLLWREGEGHGYTGKCTALKVSGHGKLHSGVDVHPGATIGARFVLDHAFGTVIGETCQIGKDAYILGGVTLGSYGIANNPAGKRHPTLGNNVQIGSFARVLGPVTIGDNVFVSPSSVITTDVPSDTRVTIVNQVQLEKTVSGSSQTPSICPKVNGAFVKNSRLIVIGEELHHFNAYILDCNYETIAEINGMPEKVESNHYELRLERAPIKLRSSVPGVFHLQLSGRGHTLTLLAPPGLTELVQHLICNSNCAQAEEVKSHEFSH
ncbi:MAG: serine O-acetyltransferase [Marinobacter sp.]|nr:serine O-acetyltransferase [Marinobacter sp.]